MGKTETVPVIVLVDDQALKQIRQVAGDLRQSGMSVDEVLEHAGTISGTIERNRLQTLSKIKGVKQVEESRTYQIAPPDSDVQ